MLFTANSAGLYTWSIEFLSYIGKSHITHVPSLLLVYTIPCPVTACCLTEILDPCEECSQHSPPLQAPRNPRFSGSDINIAERCAFSGVPSCFEALVSLFNIPYKHSKTCCSASPIGSFLSNGDFRLPSPNRAHW